MPRYPVVLLDADNTLFDFDAAEYKALRAVLRDRGYSTGQDTVDVYLSINTALWDAFNRARWSRTSCWLSAFAGLNRPWAAAMTRRRSTPITSPPCRPTMI